MAVTVAWMLSLLCTVASLAISLLLFLVVSNAAVDNPLAMAPNLLLFVALVCGSLCLILTFAVGKMRKVPPPPGITWFACCAGAAPWVVLVVLLVWQAV